MNPLLVIMAHEGVRETVERHWPYYKNTGCDIWIVTSETPAARPFRRYTIHVGAEPFTDKPQRIDRWIRVVEAALSSKAHSHFVLVEYDCVLLSHPNIPESGFGGKKKKTNPRSQFISDYFWHCPWSFDRETGNTILRHLEVMRGGGMVEDWNIDRMLGLMIEFYNVPATDLNTFSVSTVYPVDYEPAKEAIAAGAWAVHGVKDEAALRGIGL